MLLPVCLARSGWAGSVVALLAWLGAVHGHRVRPLGVEHFGVPARAVVTG